MPLLQARQKAHRLLRRRKGTEGAFQALGEDLAARAVGAQVPREREDGLGGGEVDDGARRRPAPRGDGGGDGAGSADRDGESAHDEWTDHV